MPLSIWQMDPLPGAEREVPVVGQEGRDGSRMASLAWE